MAMALVATLLAPATVLAELPPIDFSREQADVDAANRISLTKTVGWSLAGVSVATAIAWAVLGLKARATDADLESTPTTTPRDQVRARINDGKRFALLSDLSMAGALVTGGLATWVLVSW